MPLHCLMELAPKADGRMSETRYHLDVDRALAQSQVARSVSMSHSEHSAQQCVCPAVTGGLV